VAFTRAVSGCGSASVGLVIDMVGPAALQPRC
jgi:hypothetical protein